MPTERRRIRDVEFEGTVSDGGKSVGPPWFTGK